MNDENDIELIAKNIDNLKVHNHDSGYAYLYFTEKIFHNEEICIATVDYDIFQIITNNTFLQVSTGNCVVHTKNHKIKIDVEDEIINYYNSKNDWLGYLYLETNEFIYSYYWLYYNLIKHFNNQDEMKDYIKPILEKIINRKFFIKN